MFQKLVQVFLNKFATVALVMALDIVLARWYGPEPKGIFNFFANSIALTGFALTWGVQFNYLEGQRRHPERARNILLFDIRIVLVQLAVLLAAILVLWPGGADRPVFNVLLSWWVLGTAMHLLYNFCSFVLLREKGVRYSNVIRIAWNVFTVLFALVGLALGWVIQDVIAWSVGIFLLWCLWYLYYCYRLELPEQAIGLTSNEKKGLFRYGLLVYFNVLFDRLNLKIALLMLGIWAAAENVGVFAITNNLAMLIISVSESTGLLLLGDKEGMNLHEESRGKFLTIVRLSFWLNFGLIAFTAIAGFWLIPLVWGGYFHTAWYLYLVLAPGLALNTFYRILNRVFQSSGRGRLGFQIGLYSCIAQVVLAAGGVALWGSWGAALSQSVVFLLSGLLTLWLAGNILGVSVFDLLAWRSADWVLLAGKIRSISTRKRNNKA